MTEPSSRTRIALLRGINIGRAKRIAMADLRELMRDLGYEDVRTLLASGNVVFEAPGSVTGDPAARIEAAIEERAGFSARVTVLGADELTAIVEANPLLEIADDPSRLAVGVVQESADLDRVGPLLERDWSPETLAIGPRAVYSWYPNGFRDSPLQKALSAALGDSVTARNWATIGKIHALVRERAD